MVIFIDRKVPKYKLEQKDHRLKNYKLQNYKRDTKIELNLNDEWNNLDVSEVLSSNKSCRIEGLAGTGKTHTMKQLMTELQNQKKQIILLAPTNKACRQMSTSTLKARTLYSFCNQYEKSRSDLEKLKVDYIFIDEISMMHEHIYKFLLTFKQLRTDVKFILAGNFDQLKPVNDRAEFDYEKSPALFELSDGQLLHLTECKRQNDEYFNLIHPKNIYKIKKTQFTSNFTSKHLAYTNKKRIEVNQKMMQLFLKKKKLSLTSKGVLKLEKNIHDPNSQDVYLYKDMPIISKANNKHYQIVNNDLFYIKSIFTSKEDNLQYISIVEEMVKDRTSREAGKDSVVFNSILTTDFQKLFRVGFCITVHSSQGATFDEEYTIHEFEKFDTSLKYTALSRTTKKEYVNIL
jgi:ATP-dependent exoDNAse (exonuclease V) alpha subunit